MITIAPLQLHQISEAKLVLATVAFPIFKETETLEEYIALIETGHYLKDVDNFQRAYNENGGIFLVALDDDKVIGTGALRWLDGDIAELRRMWLLQQYHGQKIGYRIVQKLFEVARKKGYKRIRLQTNHIQAEAVTFYRELGFYEIPSYRPEDEDDLAMELQLQ
jgi:putative acetyltransferase